MTIHDASQKAMASAGRQLEQVLLGMKEEHVDVKLSAVAMSARETLEHLIDCYSNVPLVVEGKEPQWGSYVIEDKSWGSLTALFADLRGKAVEKILAGPEDKMHELAMDYVVMHDAYHVGQLALVRLQTDPNWDAYSIYA